VLLWKVESRTLFLPNLFYGNHCGSCEKNKTRFICELIHRNKRDFFLDLRAALDSNFVGRFNDWIIPKQTPYIDFCTTDEVQYFRLGKIELTHVNKDS